MDGVGDARLYKAVPHGQHNRKSVDIAGQSPLREIIEVEKI